MKSLKIEIVATGTEYTQMLFVDGKVFNIHKMKAPTGDYEGELKIIDGHISLDEAIKRAGRDELSEIDDRLSFLGMEMVSTIANSGENDDAR